MDKSKFEALLAKAKAMQAASAQVTLVATPKAVPTVLVYTSDEPKAEHAMFPTQEQLDDAIIAEAGWAAREALVLSGTEGFSWHPLQQQAIDLAKSGASFCLIGAAGTGKTTVMKAISQELQQDGIVLPLGDSTKFLRRGSPGMAIIAYTRRATNNIRRSVSEDMKDNCLTFHKLMEYEPVFYDVTDPISGKTKATMRFEPMRSRMNPLPPSLTTIAVEESSMFSTQFQEILDDALGHDVQFIYLGDIQQLPPTYGSAILGFKLLDLPVIELTHVYRQALKSPIIRLAHRILSGVPVSNDEALAMSTSEYYLQKWPGEFTQEEAIIAANQLKIRHYPKKVHWEPALYATANMLKLAIDAGLFQPEEDVVLIPVNGTKENMNQFGSEELNKHIAQHLALKAKAVTWEVIAGYEKHYFAVGDKVMYEKEDAQIITIKPNLAYGGTKRPQKESEHLDRWGARQDTGRKLEENSAADNPLADLSAEAIDAMMAAAAGRDSDDRVQEASHWIEIEFRDGGKLKLNTAGQINTLALAYAMTVHKAQGCEWRKVYLIVHQSHSQMINRELLYTACTRAREELTVLCEPDTFIAGLAKQRIKGNTLADKAEYFKGKREQMDEEDPNDKPPRGAFKAGVYKGNTEKPAVAITSNNPPVPLLKLHTLLSDSFKAEAQAELEKIWLRAKAIYGERLGPVPTLRFDLQKARTIGLASPSGHWIKLNSLWCLLAQRDPAIKAEMLDETLVHEVCHIIDYVFANGSAHNSGWRMTMKLMGKKPQQYYVEGALPDWASGYAQALEQVKEDMKKENFDVQDSTEEETNA